MGTVRIDGRYVSLPNWDLEHLEYVRFATTTLLQVNPNLECTREVVDGAWIATIESQKFKRTPRKVKDAALAQVSVSDPDDRRGAAESTIQAKTARVVQYWKGRRPNENLEGVASNQDSDEMDYKS